MASIVKKGFDIREDDATEALATVVNPGSIHYTMPQDDTDDPTLTTTSIWSEATLSGLAQSSDNPVCVVEVAGVYYIVSSAGRYFKSGINDLTTWTGPFALPIVGISSTRFVLRHLNGTFILIRGGSSANSGKVFTCDDIEVNTWVEHDLFGADFVRELHVNGSTAVVVGSNGRIAYSTDPHTFASWTVLTSVDTGTTEALYAVYEHGNTWVAAGDNNTVLVSTTGGASWTAPSIPPSGQTRNLRQVFYFKGEWVVYDMLFLSYATGPSGEWSQYQRINNDTTTLNPVDFSAKFIPNAEGSMCLNFGQNKRISYTTRRISHQQFQTHTVVPGGTSVFQENRDTAWYNSTTDTIVFTGSWSGWPYTFPYSQNLLLRKKPIKTASSLKRLRFLVKNVSASLVSAFSPKLQVAKVRDDFLASGEQLASDFIFSTDSAGISLEASSVVTNGRIGVSSSSGHMLWAGSKMGYRADSDLTPGFTQVITALTGSVRTSVTGVNNLFHDGTTWYVLRGTNVNYLTYAENNDFSTWYDTAALFTGDIYSKIMEIVKAGSTYVALVSWGLPGEVRIFTATDPKGAWTQNLSFPTGVDGNSPRLYYIDGTVIVSGLATSTRFYFADDPTGAWTTYTLPFSAGANGGIAKNGNQFLFTTSLGYVAYTPDITAGSGSWTLSERAEGGGLAAYDAHYIDGSWFVVMGATNMVRSAINARPMRVLLTKDPTLPLPDWSEVRGNHLMPFNHRAGRVYVKDNANVFRLGMVPEQFLLAGTNITGTMSRFASLTLPKESTWVDVTNASNPVYVLPSTSEFVTHGDNTTQQIGTGTFVATNAGISTTGTAGPTDIPAGSEVEYEYVVEVGSDGDIESGDILYFRLTDTNQALNTTVYADGVLMYDLSGLYLLPPPSNLQTISIGGTSALVSWDWDANGEPV